MAEDSRDMLMKIEVTEGQYIPSECSAVIEASPTDGPVDALADGFTKQSLSGGTEVNYFAIRDFTIPVAIKDDKAKEQQSSDKAHEQTMSTMLTRQFSDQINSLLDRHKELNDYISDLERRLVALEGRGKGGSKSLKGVTDADKKGLRPPKDSSLDNVEYARFMKDGPGAVNARTNPSDIEQISITKEMDKSSIPLFINCKNSVTLYRASILKRKAVGYNSLRGFLRFDFQDVLITSLDWDNDETVKESFKFVCRKVDVTYAMEILGGDTKLKKLDMRTWKVRDLASS